MGNTKRRLQLVNEHVTGKVIMNGLESPHPVRIGGSHIDGKSVCCGINAIRWPTAFCRVRVYDAVGATLLDDQPPIVPYGCISAAGLVWCSENRLDDDPCDATPGLLIDLSLAHNLLGNGIQVLAYLRIVALAEMVEELCILTWVTHGPQHELVSTVSPPQVANRRKTPGK